MRILLIGGKDMKVNGPSKFWTLVALLKSAGHEVRAKACVQTGKTSKVTQADVAWADVYIVYSWGCASLWHLWHSLVFADSKMLIIVAGVPNVSLLQFYVNLWHAPTFIDRAVCFDVNDIPTSCTFQNPGAVDIDFGQAIPADAKYLNINCGNLFPVIAIPSTKHVGIVEKQEVIDAIVLLVGSAT